MWKSHAGEECVTMRILSCGSGMQSTALALMSCENAMSSGIIYPMVPVYDAVIFCDLGFEPPWVMRQTEFIRSVCQMAGIPFIILDSPLHKDLLQNFGERRTVSIPWWTLKADGHKAKMPRNCTIDYKVEIIGKYVRWNLLGYKKGQQLRDEDRKAHEMHIGFSAEEQRRCKDSLNPMFVNRFPLVEMGLTRADNYAYILDRWGMKTRASACTFCPFHKNAFFNYLREHEPEQYQKLCEVDCLLRDKNPKPPMDSDLFISHSRKRLYELTPEDCDDGEYFMYRGERIWNGF